jgi:hypothetical protein
VNEFVEECRREWKRLRVSDPIADEMATDLAADLEEAEAEGVSAEEVLGISAFDPRSFAASWAAERGVIPPPPPTERPRRRPIRAAIVALTVIAVIGAALLIFESPESSAPAIIKSPSGPMVVPRGFVVPGDGSGVDIHRLGSILLFAGVVGIILSALFLAWSSGVARGHWSPRGP